LIRRLVDMSVFTEQEIAYFQQQRLGRLATVGADGMPHIVPIGYHFDPSSDTIQLGGRQDSSKTKKFRDAGRHAEVAFLVDDIVSLDPPTPRGIEIRGRAETFQEGGQELGLAIWGFPFEAAWIRITPTRIISWGIDTGGWETNSRSVS
jgi:pyridoxamine 5'-phosphate oxidase family protein